jgi:DDE superfamily endonuclease
MHKIFGLKFVFDAPSINSHIYAMSRIYKTSSEDQRRFEIFNETFSKVLQRAKDHYLSDSDSDSDSDDSSQFQPNPYLAQLYALFDVGERLEAQQRVLLEDITIDFGIVKTIDDFSEYECYNYFRFLKQDLQVVANLLWPRLSPYLQSEDPEKIYVGNRYVAHYETCFCAYLYKMSFPNRLRGHGEQFFCIRKSKLSAMIRFFGDALVHLALQYLSNVIIWQPYMEYYAAAIERKCGGLIPNIWGMIDGTIRRTCRPVRFQRLMYTRYKRCHGLKFQSVVTPDGFIAHLSGPFVARYHDARMLRESELLEQLRQMMPQGGPIYSLYGDLAYPQSQYLLGGFVNPPENSPERRFNTEMSRVRIIVEWGFANVLRRWQHLDFQRSMKVFQQRIGQQFINCVFLTNILNCFYGGATNRYFNCNIMSLEEYLALIDNIDE